MRLSAFARREGASSDGIAGMHFVTYFDEQWGDGCDEKQQVTAWP
jgi:hypothetical protein